MQHVGSSPGVKPVLLAEETWILNFSLNFIWFILFSQFLFYSSQP